MKKKRFKQPKVSPTLAKAKAKAAAMSLDFLLLNKPALLLMELDIAKRNQNPKGGQNKE